MATLVFHWTVDGEPALGDLQRYAHDVEQGDLYDVEVTGLAYLDDGDILPAPLTTSSYESGDYRVVDLVVEVPGFVRAEGRYRIDLRA